RRQRRREQKNDRFRHHVFLPDRLRHTIIQIPSRGFSQTILALMLRRENRLWSKAIDPGIAREDHAGKIRSGHSPPPLRDGPIGWHRCRTVAGMGSERMSIKNRLWL